MKTPAEALSFLAATGPFLQSPLRPGPAEEVTWRTFSDWQRIVRFFAQTGHVYTYKDESDELERLPRIRVIHTEDGEDDLPQDLDDAIAETPEDTITLLQGFMPNVSIAGDDLLARHEGRKPRLTLGLNVSTTVDAVLASIKVATMTGISFALCGREGCGALFEEKPTRGKQYCTQRCAHHASVKKQREKHYSKA